MDCSACGHANPERPWRRSSRDGREIEMNPPRGVFIPGNVPHGARNTGSGVLRLLYAVARGSFADVRCVFASAAEPRGAE